MNEIEEEKEKRKYSLVLLSIIIVSIIGFGVTVYFLLFINHQIIQLEIRDYSYNGTYLTIKLGLKTNSIIHPYGLKLINPIHNWTFTKTEITYPNDNLTITIPISIVFNDEKIQLSFLLLCDEGEFPFEVEVKSEG